MVTGRYLSKPSVKAVALAGVALTSPQMALSQQATAAAAADVSEIVVTAQKRQERLSDVPITVSAFGDEALRAAGARNLEDVANLTSNTQIFQVNGTGAPVWMIRGVGIVDFNTNNTPAAAVYVDDIYQTSAVFGSIGLFDIERVEVLKGPQGGLYGRNTSGGAVRVITKSPNLARATGELTARLGRWGRFEADVAASVPLIEDKLAARLSGRVQRSTSGWQYSIPANRRWGEWKSYAVRAQLLAKPSENLDIRLIVDAGKDDSETTLARSIGVYAPGGGFCAPVLSGRLDDSTCLTFPAANGSPSPSPNVQSKGGTRVLADAFPRNNNDTLGLTAIANLQLGGVTLTSVTGYRDFDFGQLQDNDAIPGEWGHQVSGSYFKSFSQELRLVSPSAEAFTWLVGASYAQDTLKERRSFPARDNAVFAPIFGTPLVFDLNYDQRSKSWAGFAQAAYRATEALTISGALRYTSDKKKYRNGQIVVAGLPFFPTPLADDYALRSHWSGKGSVNWKLAANSSLYASVSRGFKAGGFFGGYAFGGNNAISPYKEETVWAYEVGTKNIFAGNRFGINGALFLYDYSDVQAFGTFPDPLIGTVTKLGNVGDARHYGAELEGFVRPTDRLRLGGSLAYLDAKIRNVKGTFSSQGGEVLTYEGMRRLYAPKWSWNADVTYELPLPGDSTLRFRADANGRTTTIEAGFLADPVTGRQTGGVSNIDHAIQHIPGYTVTNGRITYEPAGRNWDLSLWGKNLLNENYRTVWGSDGLGSYWHIYGEPISYGVEFSLRW